MRSFARSFLSCSSRALLVVAVPLVPAFLAACDGGSSDAPYDDVSPRPTVTAPAPTPRPEPTPIMPEPTKPPQGPGELVVAGNVRLLGATSDGFVAYYKGVVPAKSLEVYDTKKKTITVLAASTANSDYVMAVGGTIAHWTATRSPFGHGTLRFWSAAHGLVTVPGGGSLPFVFSTNDDGSRVAFMVRATAASTLGRIVSATPATAASATEEIEPAVSTGCTIDLRHVGGRLFTSSCGLADQVATARGLDAAGKAVFTHADVRPGVETSSRGEYALTVKVQGGGTLVDMSTSTEKALPSDVTSARLAPDSTFLLASTRGESLVRASTADPSRTEAIVASGVKEVLAIAPDGRHAIVATDSVSRHSGFEKRTSYALALVSLEAPFATTTLVATPIASPRGFTESGKYVLYSVEPTGVTNDELRARPVTGGQEIALGTNVGRVSPLPGTNAFVVYADGARVSGSPPPPSTVTKIDLDAPAAPKLVASDVGAHVVVDKTVYVGAGVAGLRALPLP